MTRGRESSRGRWQRVVDARRQARLAQGRDPDVGDLFSGPLKRKAAPPYVPSIPLESPRPPDTTEYVLTLGEAAIRLDLSRADLEAMIAAGKIEALPTGYTRTIPTREVERVRASLATKGES